MLVWFHDFFPFVCKSEAKLVSFTPACRSKGTGTVGVL